MDRNKYFFDNRILLSMMPTSDIPTETHDWGWYYSKGTYQFYNLFQWDYRIVSTRSLVWHMRVIKHINYTLNKDEFNDDKLIDTFRYISNLKNKFITIEVSLDKMNEIIDGLIEYNYKLAPTNKPRKIIFKPFLNISKSEKLSICGSIGGKKSSTSESDIYEMMININDNGCKIKMKDLAKALGCSPRTLRRLITDELKIEIKNLNSTL